MNDNIPSEQEFLEIINASDALSIIVRGHQVIEAVLNLAISEVLPEPHALEVSRLNFALKVDLAAALAIIPKDSRGAYLRINKIRNNFAHQLTALFGKDESRELYNVLSPHLRKVFGKEYDKFDDELDVVRHCIAVLYISLRTAVSHIRDGKAEAQILHEMVVETLGRKHVTDSYLSEVEQELRLKKFQKHVNAETRAACYRKGYAKPSAVLDRRNSQLPVSLLLAIKSLKRCNV